MRIGEGFRKAIITLASTTTTAIRRVSLPGISREHVGQGTSVALDDVIVPYEDDTARPRRLDAQLIARFQARLPQRFDGNRRLILGCLLYTSPSPRDGLLSRMP